MRRALVFLAVLAFGTGHVAPAVADADARVSVESRPHCILTAVSDNDPGRPVPAPRCYATFAESVAAATNGRVVLPANATTVTQEQLDSGGLGNDLETTSATVLGIEYDTKDFKGWSYLIQTTNPRGCYGYSYKVSTLPSNRDNKISAARTYNGCKSSHYSERYLVGSRYLCGCSQMGTMSDKTSSIYFSSTGY